MYLETRRANLPDSTPAGSNRFEKYFLQPAQTFTKGSVRACTGATGSTVELDGGKHSPTSF
jgi:hypothetical protein